MRIKPYKKKHKIIRLLIEIEHEFYLFTIVLGKKIGEILGTIGGLIFRELPPLPRKLENNIFLSLLIRAIWYLPQIIIVLISIVIGILLLGLSLSFFAQIVSQIVSFLGLPEWTTLISFVLWLIFLSRYVFHVDDINIR